VLREQLTRLAHQDRAALGISFAISMVISLWSANAGVSALFEALTAVYEEKEKRGFIEYYAITLAFTAGAVILVLLSLATVIALPLVLGQLPNPGIAAGLVNTIRWPILFVVIALALSVVYRFGPSRTAQRWRWDHLG
jgi:membrane protein